MRPIQVGLVCLAVLHLLPSGHHPIQDALSEYGTGHYRVLYQAGEIARGLAGELLTAALAYNGDIALYGLLWLAVYSLVRILIAWFPGNLPGAARTRSGHVHVLLGLLGYIAIANAAPVIGHSLAQLPGSNGAHVTVALGYAVAAVAYVVSMRPAGPRRPARRASARVQREPRSRVHSGCCDRVRSRSQDPAREEL